MEIRQLHLFLAVMETSGVTRAAERLHLSPSAVSQQLHSLSAELGVELFVSSGKRFLPTPHAVRLAEHARSVLTEIGKIEHAFHGDPGSDNRPFHFATGATALIYRLGKPLRLLRKRFPNNEIRVTVAATEEIVSGLRNRSFDLGLISLPVSDDGVAIEPLFDEELLGLRPAPAGGRRGKIVNLEPSEIAAASFLLYPQRSNMRSIIEGFFREIGVAPRVVMEADDTEAIKRLVESGFGYSILPEYALRSLGGRFQTFRIAGRRLTRKQALATPRSDYPRPLTGVVAGMIRTSLGVTGGAHA